MRACAGRFTLPSNVWEDPRRVAAMLGLQVPASTSLRRPPAETDFLALIEALERGSGPDVWMRSGPRGPELVFRVTRDAQMTAAIKRLPGRRFDGVERVWTVPARPETVVGVQALLDTQLWLSIGDGVGDWLAADAGRWTGCATVVDHEGEPLLVLHTHSGELPPALSGEPIGRGGDTVALPCDAASAGALAALGGVEPDAAAAAALAALAAGQRPVGAHLGAGRDEDREPRFELRADWLLAATDAFLELPEAGIVGERDESYTYEAQALVYGVPADPTVVAGLRALLGRMPDIRPTVEAERLLARLEAERSRAEATVRLSLAHDDDLEVVGLGGELRPFQRAAVRYALSQRRTFLADEQGLGKTVEALAALHLDDAFPAVVVCPASMKLVWQRESERWLPGRTAVVIHGRAADGWERSGAADADLVVCNYDIVEAHARRLAERGPRAVVFDESHYCKDPRRKRTQAAIALSAAVPDDGLRLALTGTPIMNRPQELVSQLRLIGRLGDFGSGARLGRRFRGPAALERLHWHLRAHCYVRRTKAAVLPQLPPKRVARVPLELDNLAEYRLAEADVIAWLHTLPLDLRTLATRVAAALRAEQLARLNYLRRLAARGEPLVVFAHHREVQLALLDRFPEAARVTGADDAAARSAAIDAFQRDDGPPLIVCSLQAAAQGITLTRASNVAFMELDWTPARHDQAEDRCHRIGQSDAVTAYYLLAPGTIDDHMAAVVQAKRGVIGVVTDGRVAAGESTLDALVRALRAEPTETRGREAA
jgi:superfamily II DNA or RNA helicase